MANASIIGCGRMGTLHAEILLNKGFLIASLFDKNLSAISNLKEKLKIKPAKGFSDEEIFFNFLEKNPTDIVVLATTTIGRAKIIIKLLKIGIPFILSEKPICSSISEIESILSNLKSSKSKLAINHQMRYLPQYKRVKELIAEDRFGGLLSMHVIGGNFGLAMNGSHYVEAFRYLTDSFSNSVKADLETESEYSPRGNIFKESSGFVNIRSNKNQLMTINCSNKNFYGMHVTYVCKFGLINVDELSGKLNASYRKKEFRDLPSYRYGMPADFIEETIRSLELYDSTSLLLDDLLNSKNYPDIFAAINTVKTIIACYQSSRNEGLSVSIEKLDEFEDEIFKWA